MIKTALTGACSRLFHPDMKDFHKLISRRYTLALALIAVVATINMMISEAITSQQEQDAAIINKAGRQRMLSQHISLIANKIIHNLEYQLEDGLHEQLTQATHLFYSSHLQLSRPENSTLSKALHEIYFGDQHNLDSKVQRFTRSSLTLIYVHSPSQLPSIDHSLYRLPFATELLKNLDIAVRQYELEARERVIAYERVRFGLWLVIMILLLLESRFIFRPLTIKLTNTLNKAIEDESKALQAKEEAEKANAAKSTFIANISHELRTPLNGLCGMLEMLKTENDPDKRISYINQGLNSGKHLEAVINNVLDISKYDSGKLQLHETECDLQDMIKQCLAPIELACQNNQLTFEKYLSPELPNWIITDVTRFCQILNNLTSNALKFTRDGKITVEIEKSGDHMLIKVSDTGIGIAREKLDDIFSPFTQADDSTTRKYGGTGLGLSITKHLVTLMKGSIQVESELRIGTSFTISLPLKPVTRMVTPKPKGDQDCFAVIEPQASNQLYLQHLITSEGYQCLTFDSGSQFLERWHNTFQETPDLAAIIYCIDGKEAYEEMLQSLEKATQLQLVPRLLITPDSHSLDIDPNPLVTIHSKPVSEDSFLKFIHYCSEWDRKHDELLNILIAEDNAVNAQIILHLLKQMGHQTTLAKNGNEAVEKAIKQNYDLIFMDINMPEKDGLEASQSLRKQNITTPIAAMTAHAFDESVIQTRAAGMQYHLTKPIQPLKIKQVLKRVQIYHHIQKAPFATTGSKIDPNT
ncbi:ATP-binding protein [Pleionea sp. CnH1-48]|uniref:ATP-binding protein n=1 Tax=Pleionea sp. CnH1-48 TaxID=2954494 RepID=UPI002097DE41|nr:ATP-binding protein [Pleionea sp. CnH1-48]MCO7223591.1 ATP-binding protein [Pleionea sp. CnH1-48]